MNKDPKIVSNFDENAHLGISIVSCRLFDLNAMCPTDFHTYIKPIYTKLHGIYGYLCVTGHKVYFFWNNEDRTECDDVSEYFRVDYVVLNGN